MIKAIIFDFDGVIAESSEIKTSAFCKLFEQEGEGVAEEAVRHHLQNEGVSRYEKFMYIYKNIIKKPLTANASRNLGKRFSSLVVQNVVEAPFVKGAREFMESNQSRYKFFIVSGTPSAEMRQIAKKKNITRFFEAIYGSPTRKKDAVAEILKKEKINSQNAVYVGDSMSDYKAAADNSVFFIARIKKNTHVFRGVECPQIRNLRGLDGAIEKIEKQGVKYDR